MPPLFSTILATGYYDGPTDGIAIGSENNVFTFRLLDWDDGQDMRVFAVSRVANAGRQDLAETIRTKFAATSGTQLLPPQLSPENEAAVAELATRSNLIAVVATTDLLGDVAAWQPVGASLPEGTDWLQRFGLPRRSES